MLTYEQTKEIEEAYIRYYERFRKKIFMKDPKIQWHMKDDINKLYIRRHPFTYEKLMFFMETIMKSGIEIDESTLQHFRRKTSKSVIIPIIPYHPLDKITKNV